MGDVFPFVSVVALLTVMTKSSSRVVSTVDAFSTVTFKSVQFWIKAAVFCVVTAVAGW